MRLQTTIISAILILLALVACRDKGTEPYVKSIWLSAEDIGVTDASIHVLLSNDNKSSSFSLKLNGNTILSANARDTLIFSDSLLPKQTYTYKAYRLNGAIVFDSSDALTITTMDTTSHNFTWEIDTLGDGNSSVLNDVFILNDTCVYAAGEINKKDSTGNFETEPYGLAIWNGHEWRFKRLYYNGANIIAPIRGIWALAPTDIWLAAGSVFHWDGVSSQAQLSFSRLSLPDPNATVEKLWGTTSSDLYGVGYAGTIVHYSPGNWQKIESGTDVNLTDVWGSPDGSVVWACGYYDDRIGTYLLRNKGQGWEIAYDGSSSRFIIRTDSLSGSFSSVYTPDNKRIYVSSPSGMYEAPRKTKGEGKRLSFTASWFPGYPRGLRGNGRNDITIAGDYTMVAHYNGITWRYFSELRTSDMHFNAVAQKGNLIVGVGVIPDPIHSRGFVARGRR